MRILKHGTRQDLKCLLRLVSWLMFFILPLACIVLVIVHRRTGNNTIHLLAWGAFIAFSLLCAIRYRPSACTDRTPDGQEVVRGAHRSFFMPLLFVPLVLVALLLKSCR
jgi:hypothetical protein